MIGFAHFPTFRSPEAERRSRSASPAATDKRQNIRRNAHAADRLHRICRCNEWHLCVTSFLRSCSFFNFKLQIRPKLQLASVGCAGSEETVGHNCPNLHCSAPKIQGALLPVSSTVICSECIDYIVKDCHTYIF